MLPVNETYCVRAAKTVPAGAHHSATAAKRRLLARRCGGPYKVRYQNGSENSHNPRLRAPSS